MNKMMGFLLVALTAIPALGSAQSLPVQGERVRIAQWHGKAMTGSLAYVAPGEVGLLADRDGQEHVFPYSEIRGMETSSGRQRRFGKYFGIGLASTTVAVTTLSVVTWSPCESTGPFACMLQPESRGQAFTWGLVLGAALGVPMGVVTGLAIKEERWHRVTLPGSGEPRLSIRPVLGTQPGVAAAVSFNGR
jgi:hypothetical protein